DGNFAASTLTSLGEGGRRATPVTGVQTCALQTSVAGQGIAVAFTVTSGGGTPTGNVTVSDGTANCSGSVAAGTCTLTPTTAGSKTLTATYGGDANFAGSTSAGASHTVRAAGPTTAITAHTQDRSAVGQAVSFTFTVVANAPGSGTDRESTPLNASTESCSASVATGSCSIALGRKGAREGEGG